MDQVWSGYCRNKCGEALERKAYIRQPLLDQMQALALFCDIYTWVTKVCTVSTHPLKLFVCMYLSRCRLKCDCQINDLCLAASLFQILLVIDPAHLRRLSSIPRHCRRNTWCLLPYQIQPLSSHRYWMWNLKVDTYRSAFTASILESCHELMINVTETWWAQDYCLGLGWWNDLQCIAKWQDRTTKQGTPEELSYLHAETDIHFGSSEECKANKSQAHHLPPETVQTIIP
jgi:hypothetical protein